MWQQIGYAERRVGGVLADVHLHHLAVGGDHYAVQGQGQGCPLVVLDAAVVVGVQKREVVRLVQRVLLDVQARRVDVGPGVFASGKPLFRTSWTDFGIESAAFAPQPAVGTKMKLNTTELNSSFMEESSAVPVECRGVPQSAVASVSWIIYAIR